jgi:L-ascorbate metabolism protein UlaG (beta-lactamase superfamily)
MRAKLIAITCLGVAGLLAPAILAQSRPSPDTLAASGGDITIAPITHASVQIIHGPHVILVDPWGETPPPPPGVTPDPAMAAVRLARFAKLKPPSLILVTDIHADHFDQHVIDSLKTPATRVVAPAAVKLPGATTMANGDTQTIDGVTIEAVAMYNLERGPQAGQLYHAKGRGNGYVVTVGGKRLYFAGDTECTAEMKALKNIDVAFLPMNLPYTMTPAEAAECARAFKPKVVYPYHYRGQDPKTFEAALAGTGIEVRLRDWYVK